MLFSLLRSGLWGRPDASLPAARPLSGKAWEEVLALAERQTVTGVAYLGLHHLPEPMEPPVGILVRWAAKADAIERRNARMGEALGELCLLFRQNGISPVLQKGHDVAAMYAHPMLRECGDIDFYFTSEEEQAEASAIVSGHGCRVRRAPDGSDCYSWNGIPVEHHRRLLDIYSPFRKKVAERLESEYGFEDSQIVAGAASGSRVLVRVPSPMLKLLMLNLHILKHAVGRGGGLRQVCDMAVACAFLHDEIDGNEAESLIRRAGIRKWTRVLQSFMVGCLGLDPGLLPYQDFSASPDALLDLIISGGNFGRFVPEAADGEASSLRRKINTAASFLRNSGFSMTVAPEETLSVFLELLSGQRRSAD